MKQISFRTHGMRVAFTFVLIMFVFGTVYYTAFADEKEGFRKYGFFVVSGLLLFTLWQQQKLEIQREKVSEKVSGKDPANIRKHIRK